VVSHIFQACPVWIYTQSNITSMIELICHIKPDIVATLKHGSLFCSHQSWETVNSTRVGRGGNGATGLIYRDSLSIRKVDISWKWLVARLPFYCCFKGWCIV
jgi:hypothetical protein